MPLSHQWITAIEPGEDSLRSTAVLPILVSVTHTDRRRGMVVAGMGMDDLNSVLWLERELLDDLAYALETQESLAACGRDRWAARTAGDLSTASTRLRDAEVLRAVHSDAVAASLGLEPNPSLSQLAASAAEPWRTVLLDQRAHLREAARGLPRAGPHQTARTR